MSKKVIHVTDGCVDCWFVAAGANELQALNSYIVQQYFHREGEGEGDPLKATIMPDDKPLNVDGVEKPAGIWAATEEVGPLAFSEY